MSDTNFFLSHPKITTYFISGIGIVAGWLIKLFFKRIKSLILKIHSAHKRLDEIESDVKCIRNDLFHHSEKMEGKINSVSEKISSIQSLISSQFSKFSDSIEKIYLLMINKKDN